MSTFKAYLELVDIDQGRGHIQMTMRLLSPKNDLLRVLPGPKLKYGRPKFEDQVAFAIDEGMEMLKKIQGKSSEPMDVGIIVAADTDKGLARIHMLLVGLGYNPNAVDDLGIEQAKALFGGSTDITMVKPRRLMN